MKLPGRFIRKRKEEEKFQVALENQPDQRYKTLVQICSPLWNSQSKISYWIEFPRCPGSTILCSWNDGFDAFNKLKLEGQYVIENVLIDKNEDTRDTWARYQLLVDEHTTIKKVKPIEIMFDPVPLSKIHEMCKGAECFLDVEARPIRKLERTNVSQPIRVLLQDDSGGQVTWTFYIEDNLKPNGVYKNEDEIDSIIRGLLGKKITIRNGQLKYFSGFNEWQIKKNLYLIEYEDENDDSDEEEGSEEIDE